MEPNPQKLIHSFGALADLGQEVADTGDFMEMVRTSLHLLLGTLAIRRGAIIECPVHLLPEDKSTNLLAVWGVGDDYQPRFDVADSDSELFLNAPDGALLVSDLVRAPKSNVESPKSDLENEVSTVRRSGWVEETSGVVADSAPMFFDR